MVTLSVTHWKKFKYFTNNIKLCIGNLPTGTLEVKEKKKKTSLFCR